MTGIPFSTADIRDVCQGIFAPEQEGRMIRFTDNEWTMIAELLQVAQVECLALASKVPQSSMAERLRIYAEQAADYRERIEGR